MFKTHTHTHTHTHTYNSMLTAQRKTKKNIIDRLFKFYQDIHIIIKQFVLNLHQLPLEYFLMGVVFQKEAFLSIQSHLEKQDGLLKVCDYWPLFAQVNHCLETRII